MEEYKVIFTTDSLEKTPNTITVTSEEEFIEWYFLNKSKLKQTKIKFETKLSHINIDSILSLHNFLTFYQNIKKVCDKHISKINDDILNVDEADEIKHALKELVRMNNGGKFLRATLVALGYKLFNKDNNYLNLAIAIEMFQTSILIHDDIIDEDDIRRGKDTIPVSYQKYYKKDDETKKYKKEKKHLSTSMGICIGDLGFYIANGLIIDGYKNNPNFGKLFEYYNQMVIKTCKGEMLDVVLPFEQKYFNTSDDLTNKIFEIYKLKTAYYSVTGPFSLGLILGGADDKKINELEDILINAGIAFQIKDDILGIFGNQKLVGKNSISDIEEYKQTILYSYVIKSDYKDEFLKYYGKENLAARDIEKVKEIFISSGALAYAKKIMNDLFQKSLDDLEKIDLGEIKSILKGFIIYLRHRNK